MGCRKSNILMITSPLHTVPKLISHGQETNEKGEDFFLMEGASVINQSVLEADVAERTNNWAQEAEKK